MTRQQTRRTAFLEAFAAMPLWETWQDEKPAPTADDPDRTKLVGNFKAISRQVRRAMAREFSKTEWKRRTA